MVDTTTLLLLALYTVFFGGLITAGYRKQRERQAHQPLTREELIRDQHTHARQRFLQRQQNTRP